jgi:hypothetical protein
MRMRAGGRRWRVSFWSLLPDRRGFGPAGRARGAWIGFAVFGWIYMSAAFWPSYRAPKLPTQSLLELLAPWIVGISGPFPAFGSGGGMGGSIGGSGGGSAGGGGEWLFQIGELAALSEAARSHVPCQGRSTADHVFRVRGRLVVCRLGRRISVCRTLSSCLDRRRPRRLGGADRLQPGTKAGRVRFGRAIPRLTA